MDRGDILQFVIVTGLSGSGKSGAVNVLEDIGYYCIDNMPPELIPKFADICSKSDTNIENIAIVTDIRGGDMFLKLKDTVIQLQKQGLKIKILFLDANDEVLIKRYKETRRKHPLDDSVHGSLPRAIKAEREMLLTVKEMADYYVDTSLLSIAELKERINSIFLDNADDFMQISVMSFGFKYGANTEADLVFDVRCLPNPFYIPELKTHTGIEECVSSYVMQFEQSKVLLLKLEDMIDFLIPLYIKEGKSQLVIAFGCTGGKHRSVTFAESIYTYLKNKGIKVRITHRDINKH